MKAAIFTINTEMYQAEGECPTATALRELLEQVGFEVKAAKALPAEQRVIETVMKQLSESQSVNLILTIGANGYLQDDCAPDAVMDVVERLLPGIGEAIRAYNLKRSKKAMLDCSVAGIHRKTLIMNLSAQEKLALADLEYILPEVIEVVETIC